MIAEPRVGLKALHSKRGWVGLGVAVLVMGILVPALSVAREALCPGDAACRRKRRDEAQWLGGRPGPVRDRRAGHPQRPAGRADAHSEPIQSGSVTVNRVPAPTALRTAIEPP